MKGKKDLLGMWIGDNEGARFWLSIVTELKNRGGVEDILISSVDGLKGFSGANKQRISSDSISKDALSIKLDILLKYVVSKYQKEFIKLLQKMQQKLPWKSLKPNGVKDIPLL